jgi:hypothetical protein
MKETVHADRVQIAYAGILHIASSVGIVLIVAGYIAYVSGVLPTAISAPEVAQHWHLKASEFHKAVHFPGGWQWTDYLGLGDVISYASINYLAFVTVICLTWIIPAFIREKDRIYTVMTILQVMVLLFAAAGIVSGGH